MNSGTMIIYEWVKKSNDFMALEEYAGNNEKILLERKNPENFEAGLKKLAEMESEREIQRMLEARARRSEYVAKFIQYRFDEEAKGLPEPKELPEHLRKELSEKLQEIDRKFTTEAGVHFLKCQFSKIIDALRIGKRVEFEAFGPYLRDYIAQGLDPNNNVEYATADKIGLEIMGFLRQEVMPEAHPVAFIDEYNMGNAVSQNITGLPADSSKLSKEDRKKYTQEGRREVSDAFIEKFRTFAEKLMLRHGIIKETEKEGQDSDYLILSEKQKTEEAPMLVKLLEEKGLIEFGSGEEIWFQNKVENCDDPRYLRIQLRDAKGVWQCPALDASGFLDPKNREIVHLVILPKPSKENQQLQDDDPEKMMDFEVQQDQVWEILHTLGFQPTNYHNVFFEVEKKYDDPKYSIDPEPIIDSFRRQLANLL